MDECEWGDPPKCDDTDSACRGCLRARIRELEETLRQSNDYIAESNVYIAQADLRIRELEADRDMWKLEATTVKEKFIALAEGSEAHIRKLEAFIADVETY